MDGMSEGSSTRRPGIPRDMPDQQAGPHDEEQPARQEAPDVPGTDEPGTRPRGGGEDEDGQGPATPEPHEPTD